MNWSLSERCGTGGEQARNVTEKDDIAWRIDPLADSDVEIPDVRFVFLVAIVRNSINLFKSIEV